MKYLIVDDEHQLYQRMFSDLYSKSEYDIEQIPRVNTPRFLKPLYKIHFCDKINRHFWLPFKMIWKPFYALHRYSFDDKEQYCVIILNGSLRYHFSEKYLRDVRKNHPNVRLALLLYDSSKNATAKRSFDLVPCFDYVFSIDAEDCKRYRFEPIYSTFSMPNFVKEDLSLKSSAFFVGFGTGRLPILQSVFEKITEEIENCRFFIAGVKETDKKPIKNVTYNQIMPYDEELQRAFNTDCIVEILKEGQTGITLRTCEAVAFNKKLLTNNLYLKKMPFYDKRYMQVFSSAQDIDIDFIRKKMTVDYQDRGFFSPLNIIRRLEELSVSEKES